MKKLFRIKKLLSMKRFPCILMILLLSLTGFSQVVITELFENPVIKEAIAKQDINNINIRSAGPDEPAPIHLPFFDDFSVESVYPDPVLWADNEVYVNSNYPYRSINIGAATFDAIDSRGNLHANASTFGFKADSLTSHPIRMDSLFIPEARAIVKADSIYFSFFYQPQGLGNKPEPFDSLVLEFGYYNGEYHFAGYYDSITVPASAYIAPLDTIWPGDTIYSPLDQCDTGLFMVSNRIYVYESMITLPCDSVFLETIDWKWIWSSEGMSLEEFYDIYFTNSKQVMIPITDSTLFFRKDFRFRFFNYASLASNQSPSWLSNCDHWNIDYVYLNTGRSAGDTIYRDISFVERATSMLENYEAMPYNQYKNDPTNEIIDDLELYITNLNTLVYNSRYSYHIEEEDGTYPYTYKGELCSTFPFWFNGYQNCVDCPQHACPPVGNYIFPLDLGDSATFKIDHVVLGDFTLTDTIGDTITYYQNFHNYYAYDDGTPEAGYGTTPSGSQLAYRFSLNTLDTLRAIQMYFNRTQNNANEEFFTIMVWKDNNGIPGDEIYSQQGERVKYSNSLSNFYTYMLDEPLVVNGIFYIGWKTTTNANLNLGYDRNRDSRENIFTNTLGFWEQSVYSGALLMRPLLGKEFDILGIDEPPGASPGFTLYPNPMNGQTLRIDLGGILVHAPRERLMLSIYNIVGQKVYDSPYQEEITLQGLERGVYIVRLIDLYNQKVFTSKLVIAH